MKGSRPKGKGKKTARAKEALRGLAGVGGSCFCLWCGHHELHLRGIPCATIKCPECGFAMTNHLAVM